METNTHFDMAHTHEHHHTHTISSLNGIFIASIVLNLLFVVVEAGVGLYENSLSLLSDAGHNLGDVFSLLLALFAFQLAKRHSTPAYTYGYKKGTVLISLVNAIILLVAVGAIIVESIRKFSHPVPVDGAAVSWTAGVGILVNGLTAWWLMRGQKNDLNVRGAFLHMVADTVVSVGVVVAGVVISLTGWTIVDPLLSLAIAVVILASTWKLLSESLRLSLDGTPEGIDLDEVLRLLESAPHVAGVHHLHVWALSTTETALTAHVVVDDWSLAETAREQIKERLKAMGIGHSTLELESGRTRCHSTCCD